MLRISGTSLIFISSVGTALLIDSAIKGAVVLVFITIITLLMWRASAASRHSLWMLAVCALFLIPLLSSLLPKWHIVPEWSSRWTSSDPKPVASQIIFADDNFSGNLAGDGVDQSPESFISPLAYEAELNHRQTTNAKSDPVMASIKSKPSDAKDQLGAAILIIWAFGTLAMLLRLVVSQLCLWRLSRRCERVTGGRLFETMLRGTRRLKLKRSVRLYLSTRQAMPMTWGVFRPSILLPSAAEQWSDEQLRCTLLHELSHVQRSDCLSQLVAQLTCAMHWFNPLAWFAMRCLYVERERACDDVVLRNGVKASAYAEQLLCVTSGLHPNQLASYGSVSLASSPSIGRRLKAILSEEQNRRPVNQVSTAVFGVLLLGVVAPLAMLQTARGESQDGLENSVATSPMNEPHEPLELNPRSTVDEGEALSRLAPGDAPKNYDLFLVRGRVVHRTTAVKDADIQVRLIRNGNRFDKPVKSWRLKSDLDGKYQLECSLISGKQEQYAIEIDIVADGFVDFRRFFYRPFVRAKSQIEIPEAQLNVGRLISGRCLGVDSKPVADAVIRCVSYPATGKPSSARMRTADKDGRFKLTLPSDAPGELLICSAKTLPRRVSIKPDASKLDDIMLESAARIKGRVLSRAGQPVASCLVSFESIDRGDLPGAGFSIRFAAKTDSNGRFEIPPVRGRFEVGLAERLAVSQELENPLYTSTTPPPLLPEVLEFDGKSATPELTLRCAPEVNISGTIVMSDGKPAVGADVILHAAVEVTGPKSVANFMRQVRTDATGSYRFAGLPRGLTNAYLVIPPRQLPNGDLTNAMPLGKVAAKYEFITPVLTIVTVQNSIEHLDFRFETLGKQVTDDDGAAERFRKVSDRDLLRLGMEFERRLEAWEKTVKSNAANEVAAFRSHPRNALAFRFVQLAEKHADHSVSLSALRRVFLAARVTGDLEAQVVKAKERGIDIVLARHLDHPNLLMLFDYLKGDVLSTRAETLLRSALSKSPHRDVRGAAAFYLAYYLRKKARLPEAAIALRERGTEVQGKEMRDAVERLKVAVGRAAEGVDPVKLRDESRQLFQHVIDEYGNVAFTFRPEGPAGVFCTRVRRSDTAPLEEQSRFFLNSFHVALGEPAPEIVGVDVSERLFSLSDYRGKVVVLMFTANWCVPCKTMYPDLRALVERMDAKSFALLSVSADRAVETLKNSVENNEITWRCWWDGARGPIATDWGVGKFPSVYVIDHRGIIRLRDSTDIGELNRVVDQLVKQADKR